MRDSLALLALSILLFLPALGWRDLWAPDEPRQAEVAREMLQSGDWLVPRDSGRVYADKPPLLPWLIALASWPSGGVSEWSARVPAAMCAAGTVLLTAAIGRLWFGRWIGFAAGVILATSGRGFISARWVQTDAPLALFTTLAVYGLVRAREHPAGPRRADLACVVTGIAGALLAKGPVGLVVPALAALGWAWLEPDRGWLRCFRPWLLVPAVAPALAWAFAASVSAGGEYALAEVLQRQVYLRFTEGLHHARSPLYYLGVFPLEFLPWTLFLVAWILPAGERGPADAGRRRAGIWLGLCLLFFSLSADKRGVYLLPAVPAAALLVAGSIPREPWPRRGGAGRLRLLAPFVALVALCPLALFVPPLARRIGGAGETPLWCAAAAACALAASALGAAVRGRARTALACAAAAPACLLLAAALIVAPALDPLKSARPFCDRVRRHLGETTPLAIHSPYRSAYAFYTGRFLEEIRGAGELERFMARPQALCILERAQLEALPAPLDGRYKVLEEGPVGHRPMALIGLREGAR
jgi:4-amino-4-deoxy-L-arabinose transferase-like glycosyltransferase